MANYVLENDKEAARLEKMASLHAYQTGEEVAKITFPRGCRVLDAGCGSGRVARHIADHNPGIRVEGCDQSEVRIEQARELRKAEGREDIRYFVSPIEKIDVADNTYDRITCRYVFEFLADPMRALAEFKRVLKPGGQLLVIQFDGFLHNFHHKNSELMAMLKTLEQRPPVDNFRGRKIPSMMMDAGFNNVDWDVKVYGWKGKDLEGEREQMYERLDFAAPMVGKLLEIPEGGARFRDLYVEEMMKPGSVLFYNKFLVSGTKA